MIQQKTYFQDLGLILDIESLSISLTTKSFPRKNNVPSDTLTGIRTKSATSAVGPNIFKLSRKRMQVYQINLKKQFPLNPKS